MKNAALDNPSLVSLYSVHSQPHLVILVPESFGHGLRVEIYDAGELDGGALPTPGPWPRGLEEKEEWVTLVVYVSVCSMCVFNSVMFQFEAFFQPLNCGRSCRDSEKEFGDILIVFV